MEYLGLILFFAVIFGFPIILDVLDKFDNSNQNVKYKIEEKILDNCKIKNDENLLKCIELINKGKNILITGGAGVGKSTLLKKLLDYNKDIYLTSTTGISAYNINGETLHSFLGVGICNENLTNLVHRIETNNHYIDLYNKIKRCKIIAIDEISMLGYKHFIYMDSFLKIIRGNNFPFGGIQIIAVGDFFQLPPVKDNYVFIDNNSLWKSFDFKPIVLNKIWRQKDLDFIQNLNKIRIGKVDNDVLDFFSSNIKKECVEFDNITHFYSHKWQVNKFNKQQLKKNKNREQIFYADDYKATWNNKTNDFILSEKFIYPNNFDEDGESELSKNTLSRYKLVLKEDCKVLVTKNLNSQIVNGTIGNFKRFSNECLIIEVKGKEYSIPKEQFEIRKNGFQKSLVRLQYPVILAYALTIHKAQGLTLENAVIDISKVFEVGQVYVAMSRIVEKENLIILNSLSKDKIRASDKVIEFYKQL